MIKFLDLHKINNRFKEELETSFSKSLDTSYYILGPNVDKFEREFANYCGTDYCVGTANGLDALTLILRGYIKIGKLKKGDKVLVPANTFIATILSVIHAELEPVLVEPDPATYNISLQGVKASYTEEVKAIIMVHLYGQLADFKSLKSLANDYNLLLIEDAAQAHGATSKDKKLKAGNLADAAAFSFYPSKNLGALGDGGAVTTNDNELYEAVTLLRNYGSKVKYENEIIGYNSRLDDLQAAFLSIKLKVLDADNKVRRTIAKRYINEITNSRVRTPFYEGFDNHVFYAFVVEVDDRDDFINYLNKNNIEWLIHYPVPPHKQQALERFSYLKLPITEQIHKRIISLPISSVLTDKEVNTVVEVVNAYQLKKFFHYINNEVLVKAASLNTANLSIKILAGILISKFIALFIGPEGMALIGNLRNFLSTAQSISIAGLYNGFVKLIGKCKNNVAELTSVLSTVFYFGFFSSLILAFFCYYNAEFINELIFFNNNYVYVIEKLAIVLPFYALNMFAFAIMNGFSKYRILLIINIIGQILGLLVTLLLIKQENIDGALIAVVITPALNLLITIVGIAFRKNLMSIINITDIQIPVLRKLSPYMVMALVSSVALPIVYIIIRNYIISEIGMKEAGYWTAVTRVSDYYLMFINSLMALYILPRFAELKSRSEFRKEVFSFYKTVLPIFAIILGIIYLSRSLLVSLLFTEEFRPVEDLMGYQILGDFMRVMSMVIAYKFLAKKMFTHFIIIEVFLFVIMYFSSIYFIDVFGIKGAVMGHCLSYLMHFGIVLLIFGSSLFGVINDDGIDDF